MKDTAQAIDKPMVESTSREDRIREAAYLRHLSRDGGEAEPDADWLAAETEIDAADAAGAPSSGTD